MEAAGEAAAVAAAGEARQDGRNWHAWEYPGIRFNAGKEVRCRETYLSCLIGSRRCISPGSEYELGSPVVPPLPPSHPAASPVPSPSKRSIVLSRSSFRQSGFPFDCKACLRNLRRSAFLARPPDVTLPIHLPPYRLPNTSLRISHPLDRRSADPFLCFTALSLWQTRRPGPSCRRRTTLHCYICRTLAVIFKIPSISDNRRWVGTTVASAHHVFHLAAAGVTDQA